MLCAIEWEHPRRGSDRRDRPRPALSCAGLRVPDALRRKERIVMRKLLVIAMLVFALTMGFSSPARAATPLQGSGTITITSSSTLTLIKQAGRDTFYSHSFTEDWTGILAGACSATETIVFHPDGTKNGRGLITCAGTAAGQPGTFSIDFVAVIAADGSAQASFVVSGTGALANLSGQGAAQGSFTTGQLTYAVGLLFHP